MDYLHSLLMQIIPRLTPDSPTSDPRRNLGVWRHSSGFGSQKGGTNAGTALTVWNDKNSYGQCGEYHSNTRVWRQKKTGTAARQSDQRARIGTAMPKESRPSCVNREAPAGKRKLKSHRAPF